MTRTLRATSESWPLLRPFAIANANWTESLLVTVEIRDGEARGRGECSPEERYDETAASVLAQIESVRAAIERGAGREELQRLLPHGAARNAVDCALWDLKAKQKCYSAADLAGRPPLLPQRTAFTIVLGSPAAMAEQVRQMSNYPLLKLKLGGDDGDIARVEAVRRVAPAAKLIVDANEAWSVEHYRACVPHLRRLGVELIEQPLHADADEALAMLPRPIPVCADESCHTTADLDRIAGRYDFINIKLDKTGGLTEALRLAEAASSRGYGLMIGCQIGTSLSMAPAHLIAQCCDYVDLDAPLFFARDREHPMHYRDGVLFPPDYDLWG